MTAPKRSLVHFLNKVFDLDTDSAEFTFVFYQTVFYLTKYISAFEYQHSIKKYCTKQSAKVVRLMLHETKYLCLSLKLFVFKWALVRCPDFDKFKQLTKDEGISVSDAKRIYKLWTTNRTYRATLKREAKRLPDKTMLEAKRLDIYFNDIYSDILRYAKHVVYIKLRFIYESNNLCKNDLAAELVAKALQALYQLSPIDKPKLHVSNYLKRVVKNHALNIIQMHTSLKRKRLVKVDNGFQLNVMSESQLGLKEELNYEDVLPDFESIRRFESEYSIAQILDKYKQREKKFRFLLILLGKEDEQFTLWLRKRRYCKPNESNDEVQLRTDPKQFNMYLSEFLNIAQYETDILFFSLKKDLGFDERSTKAA